jgi:hypothetical protein
MKIENCQKGFIQVVIVVLLLIIVVAIAIPNINSCRGPGDGPGDGPGEPDRGQNSPVTRSDESIYLEEQEEKYFVIKIMGDSVYIYGIEQSELEKSIEEISTVKEVAIHFSGDAKAYIVDKVVFLVKERGLIIAEKKEVSS